MVLWGATLGNGQNTLVGFTVFSQENDQNALVGFHFALENDQKDPVGGTGTGGKKKKKKRSRIRLPLERMHRESASRPR